MKIVVLVAATVASTLAPVLVCAAAGAYEINQDCAAVGCFSGDSAGFPVTITKAGSYVLTSDLLAASGTDAIDIDIAAAVSPMVDIDLNGHTIDGGGHCVGSPVGGCTISGGVYGINQIYHTPPGVVRVHNGTIKGFTNTSVGTGAPAGIFLGNAADGSVLEHLNVLENGSSGISIFADVAGVVHVRDSRISRNHYYGLFDYNVNNSVAVLVAENSEFSANGTNGIVNFGNKSTVSGCRFYGNGGAGITGTSNTLALGQSTFSGNNSAGAQYNVSTLRDMGGNVCLDHMPCP